MENNIFKLVGNNILNILSQNGLTQQYLADKLEISKQVMSKIISGGKAINVIEISQIANALDVSTDLLLKVDNNEKVYHNFSFMGNVSNGATKEKIEVLQNVIDELLMLEEYENDK